VSCNDVVSLFFLTELVTVVSRFVLSAGMTRSASIEMPRASRSAKRAPESINRQRADALWRCMKPALRPAGGRREPRRQNVDDSRLRAAKIFYQGVWAAIAIGRQRQPRAPADVSEFVRVTAHHPRAGSGILTPYIPRVDLARPLDVEMEIRPNRACFPPHVCRRLSPSLGSRAPLRGPRAMAQVRAGPLAPASLAGLRALRRAPPPGGSRWCSRTSGR